MSTEKYDKVGELPVPNTHVPVPQKARNYRRIAARCAVATLASVWLVSHTSGRWLQDHKAGHGLRGKKAEELFL